MSYSTSVESLFPKNGGAYSASASVKNGSVDPSTSSTTGSQTGGLFTTEGNEMKKDDFLLLLVSQLKLQDPLNPMDNSEFLNQLAQLRAIEGTNNIQTAVEGLKDAFAGTVEAQKYSAQSISNSSAVSLIGKEVRLRETQVKFGGRNGEVVPLRVHLGNNSSAQVNIVDAEGNTVKSLIAEGKDRENSALLTWDGTAEGGARAKPGTYQIQIAGQEQDPSLYAFVEDVVGGVRFSQNGALIKVGGKEMSIGNIMDVSSGSGSQPASEVSPAAILGLLDKQVRMRRDSLYYAAQPGEEKYIRVKAGMNEELTVRIKDRTGQTVRTLRVEATNGEALVHWDGRISDEATFAERGLYHIEIEEAKGDPGVYAFEEGIVKGISTVDGVTKLRMNGELVSLSDIIDVAPAPVQEETA